VAGSFSLSEVGPLHPFGIPAAFSLSLSPGDYIAFARRRRARAAMAGRKFTLIT